MLVNDGWGEPVCGHATYEPGCGVCEWWQGQDEAMRAAVAAAAKVSHPWRYHRPDAATVTRGTEILNRVRSRRIPGGMAPPPGVGLGNAASVLVPARVPLPTLPPCKHEGGVVTWCRACADGFKVRHCELPTADWDFCARKAVPLNAGKLDPEYGRSCETCEHHTERGT